MTRLLREERAQAIGRLQHHFRTERGEELGDLAAGFLLDFIEEEIAPFIHNRAISEAEAVAARHRAGLEEDLAALRVLRKAGR